MILKTHHAVILTSTALAMLVGLGIWLLPSHRLRPDRRIQRAGGMPAAAEQVLRGRMQRHGEDMRDLIMAVILVDFEQAQALSQRIAADANLARPLSGDATELNALLPAGFFTLQDELRARTTRLAAAAGEGSSTAVSEAFSQVTQTCVSCHMLYALDPAKPR